MPSLAQLRHGQTLRYVRCNDGKGVSVILHSAAAAAAGTEQLAASLQRREASRRTLTPCNTSAVNGSRSHGKLAYTRRGPAHSPKFKACRVQRAWSCRGDSGISIVVRASAENAS
jgi:hypothetical protein